VLDVVIASSRKGALLPVASCAVQVKRRPVADDGEQIADLSQTLVDRKAPAGAATLRAQDIEVWLRLEQPRWIARVGGPLPCPGLQVQSIVQPCVQLERQGIVARSVDQQPGRVDYDVRFDLTFAGGVADF